MDLGAFSVSLAVKDLAASKTFYEKIGFTAMGGDSTLVRIVQGPYDPAVAQYHAAGWEKELARLGTYLDGGQA